MMLKRSQGRRRFCRNSFKQRFFRLTTQSLSYAKSRGKNSFCDIPLSEILAVERLNERSFKMQNIFQVNILSLINSAHGMSKSVSKFFNIVNIFVIDCAKRANDVREMFKLRRRKRMGRSPEQNLSK